MTTQATGPVPRRLLAWLDLMTIGYGLWLLLPLDTFAGALLYRGLIGRAPEWFWGLIFALPAILSRLICRRGHCSTNLMLGGAMAWGFFFGLAIQAYPATGGTPLFAGLMLGYLWCWWQVPVTGFRHWLMLRRRGSNADG